MIAIVDYGSGNIKAIGNVFKKLNMPFYIASSVTDLKSATKILLPGVGSFDYAMSQLLMSGMKDALDKRVLCDKVPVLGICVGMQLLAKSSDEGQLPGLGWIDGVVKKFDFSARQKNEPLPHMGWNEVHIAKEHALFSNVDLTRGYYFLHSYYFNCHHQHDVLTTTFYMENFVSAVCADHIMGVQFHPEKSHRAGIQLLKNFGNFLC